MRDVCAVGQKKDYSVGICLLGLHIQHGGILLMPIASAPRAILEQNTILDRLPAILSGSTG